MYSFTRYCRYSFDYGIIHVVVMSTEHNFTQGSPQYQYALCIHSVHCNTVTCTCMHRWLVEDLSSVNRSVTPWVVMAGHRMFVCIPPCHLTHSLTH